MNEQDSLDFNRRDFLRSGSLATLMTMLGGVELIAQTTNAPGADDKPKGPRVKVGVIGIGPWGREILNTLARLPQAEVVAVCDTYAAMAKRGGTAAPGATVTADYKTILDNKDITAVVIATPTHLHKDIAVAALKAGKHVYCEAPLAHTIEDARAIALAAKAAPGLVFQAGLQMRSDPQRHFLLPFIRSGALGKSVMARAQFHKKQTWRQTSPNPEREKAVNWRLDKEVSLGLVGELGCHPIDQVTWYFNGLPKAATGFGSIIFHQDGRDGAGHGPGCARIPGGCEHDLSRDAGQLLRRRLRDALRQRRRGDDAREQGVDVQGSRFAAAGLGSLRPKETFYKETGIALVAGASKSSRRRTEGGAALHQYARCSFALGNFLRNASDFSIAAKDFIESFGDDADALKEHLTKLARQPAAGILEGYQATVIAIKTNEAIMTGKRVEIKPEMYELT